MTLPTAIAALPYWQGALTARPVSGGLSNEIWHITDEAGEHIVRLGEDYPFHHVDRAREAMVTAAAHAAGFGPALRYVQPGVMITNYLRVKTWTADDVRAQPDRVVGLINRFHRALVREVSGPAFLFCPFHTCRDYARTLSVTRHAVGLSEVTDLAARLEARQIPLPLVFGHNDLLPANILEDDQRLWLVDYEYAGFASPLFDLAGLASNAGMSADEGYGLLSLYDFGPHRPEERALRHAFDAMRVAALLREWLWALVSDVHLSAPGVDYMDYAAENRARLDRALADLSRRWDQ